MFSLGGVSVGIYIYYWGACVISGGAENENENHSHLQEATFLLLVAGLSHNSHYVRRY